MVQAMDHGAIERAMGGTSNDSDSNRRMVRAVDQEAIEGETDGARDESGINRRRELCERLIREL